MDRDVNSLDSSIDQGSTEDYHSCGQCLLDGNDVESHGLCADCPEYLCANCFREHTRPRAFRHHKLHEIGKIPNVKITNTPSKICTEKCSVHEQEVIKFFCSNHDALCCNACVVLDHRHCEMDYIPEKCSEIDESAEYQKTLGKLDAKQKIVDYLKLAAKKTEGEIEETEKSVMNEIRIFEQELLDHFRKLRNKVEREAKTEQTTNTQTVNTVFDTCNKVTSKINQHRKEILTNKKGKNLAQLFIAIKRAKSDFKTDEINNSIKRLGATRTRFRFERNEDMETLASNSECFGTLKGHTGRVAVINNRRKGNFYLVSVALCIDSFHIMIGYSTRAYPKSVAVWRQPTNRAHIVPTSLLINPDGKTTCAFGNMAERKYEELVGTGEETKYFYYHGGYIDAIYRGMDNKIKFVPDVSRKELPSILVLSALVRVLKDEAATYIKKQSNIFGHLESDFHFVITVPERYETASEVMKVAAKQAGIDSECLTIVFDTEAAFTYIQDAEHYESRESPVKQSPGGAKFLVLNAEETFFTTTVYEISNNETMQIYHEAMEYCKGKSLSEELLSSLLGQDIAQKFRDTHPDACRELSRSIELAGKGNKSNRKFACVTYFQELYDLVKECTGGTVNDLIREQKLQGKCTGSEIGGRLKIDICTFKSFFEHGVSVITSQLHFLLQYIGTGCDDIVLIGSFSDYNILQDGLKTEFPDIKVLVPKHTEEAVVIGAAVLGHYSA